ncbi:hypothetical protein [Acinetobacter sp. BWR-L5]|uniref:hypothetical protein n=1 Tax=Acinetobacter sp. BWR-L5 TaxID=2815725 RepID=UPI0031FF11A9
MLIPKCNQEFFKIINKWYRNRWSITLLFCIFIIWIFFPFLLTWLAEHLNFQIQNADDVNYGTFGDTYGALNTLFSGLAFAVLIITLFLQRKELHDQRLEIQRATDIAEGQRKITDQQRILIEQQIHDVKVQNFYTLFFKFLDEKHRKVEEMDKRLTNGNFNGDTHFDKFIYFIENHFGDSISKLSIYKPDFDNNLLKNVIHEAVIYANRHTANVILDSEYIEYLCFILRFIESHKELDIIEDAIQIFVSYQSFNESYTMLLMTIYLGDDELKNYIVRYALLRKIKTSAFENDNFFRLADALFGKKSYSP